VQYIDLHLAAAAGNSRAAPLSALHST